MDELATVNDDLAVIETRPLDQNPAAVYLAGLNSSTSRRTQKQALDRIAGLVSNGRADALSFSWHSLRFQHTAAIRARLLETGLKPATINKMLCALRGVLKAAWRLNLMTSEDYQRARDIEGVTGTTLPAGRELSSGEIGGLMGVCENDTTAAGVRDAAIIALLYSCGLRRDELVNLDLADYNRETGALKVFGKRNKERIVYLTNGAFNAVNDWLTLRGNDPGALFVPVLKSGKIVNRQMQNEAVWGILRKRAAEAGVKDFTPHDLRRTFISDLLDAGADIATISKMAGHASVNTTARYDRRPEEAKRKAAQLLHVPYRGILNRVR